MNQRDLMFVLGFAISLVILVYFLGTSIIGYVTQSMYCDEEGCKEFCRFNTDCINPQVCCQKDDFGVCGSSCTDEYKFQPNLDDVDLESVTSYVGGSAGVTESKIYLYAVLIILAAIVGIKCFYSGKKTSKRKKKRKKK